MHNSAAMRAAKIKAGDRIEPGGVVCVDAAGEATGVLLEGAASRAWERPRQSPTGRLASATFASWRLGDGLCACG